MIKKIQSLKSCEIDKDIYILANAPSVKSHDLRKLKGKIVIGMNANPLLEKEFGFVSDYYVVSDLRFINHPEKRKMATEMLNHKTKRIFKSALKKVDDKMISNDTYYIETLGKNGFSFDLNKGYYFGCTTTMLAIQLAYYLGAKNIYLLGVDLRYSGDNPRFYKETEVQEFDSFTSVQLSNIRNAYNELQTNNVNLFNCEKKSLLFPYLPYKNFKEI
jgi:hypothetical protein